MSRNGFAQRASACALYLVAVLLFAALLVVPHRMPHRLVNFLELGPIPIQPLAPTVHAAAP